MSDRSVHAPSNVPVMTLAEQADWLLALWDRTFLVDGDAAAGAALIVTREDGDVLHAIGSRMHRMSAHEAGIRALVTGRVE